ncbi:uncharacterized protein LOC116033481 [Ipomoea triloba]|uniref:uncharacterized protein LOC116033481 n=1 Tax=Ipomoea triloba TaxID=35885 RepID=UPI00125CE1E7|nr:uncharacterized protein LOC116033481 [Ipomoea triloba]XP_031132083.1 uncharacterized protein LOC116033481 [Ipomoea triloba]XP_031132084.1 uncharacterized protein LOC116033481 [Ipomoea triloba]XP_031132085.1 uncharacterized protein LOC116033481 [Ipomoea triloba]XP_031132086.1 uncharacterized protein LOC116033481 [Ipomoea triloba]XP_031132087.1 uncharacterized protein LOC116033481 [Ipomoea triloba]
MAMGMKEMSIIIATLGLASFIFGVVAENKKPAYGTAIPGKGIVICKYPSDPTPVFGYLSVAFLLASTVVGYFSLFYPYKGKSIPQSAFFKNTSFLVFFNIALGTTGLAAAFLLWPTITEQLHITNNIHQDLQTGCPTAKTGLLGGGAFLSLDSSLFWLVLLMLANNAREDYLEDEGMKGGEGYAVSADYEADVPISSKASH